MHQLKRSEEINPVAIKYDYQIFLLKNGSQQENE